MNKTKIEWTDYTWNPVKGLCPQGCYYCYAREIYKRFKWDKKLRLAEDVLWCDRFPSKPSKIFVGSMIELFHTDIPDEWIIKIINRINNSYDSQKHTFFFLSKNPLRYLNFKFPNNCWCGITNTGEPTKPDYLTQGELFAKMTIVFEKIKNNFISFEPLLSFAGEIPSSCKWVIIGAMTGQGANRYSPRQEWVENLLKQADKHNIPIFMKNNLKPYWHGKLRQEFPNK